MWITGGEGKVSSVVLQNNKQDSYNFGYVVIHDGTTIATGLPSDVSNAILSEKDVNLII